MRGLSEANRAILASAAEKVKLLHNNYIGTEHILLALCDIPEITALLQPLGVDATKVAAAVRFIVSAPSRSSTENHIVLTPQAKRVLDFSLDEAHRFGIASQQAGPAFLLLGVMHEGEDVSAGVLETVGVTLTKLRDRVSAYLQHITASPTNPPLQFMPQPPIARTPERFSEVYMALRQLWYEETPPDQRDALGQHLLGYLQLLQQSRILRKE